MRKSSATRVYMYLRAGALRCQVVGLLGDLDLGAVLVGEVVDPELALGERHRHEALQLLQHQKRKE